MPAVHASDGARRARGPLRDGGSAGTGGLPLAADCITPQPGTTRSVLPGMTLRGIQPRPIADGLA